MKWERKGGYSINPNLGVVSQYSSTEGKEEEGARYLGKVRVLLNRKKVGRWIFRERSPLRRGK